MLYSPMVDESPQNVIMIINPPMKPAEIFTHSLGDGCTITVTNKYHAFNVFTQPDEDLWTFDRKGRLVGMFLDSINYRRSLDNVFYKKSRFTENGFDFREMDPIQSEEADNLLSRCFPTLESIIHIVPDQHREMIHRILEMDFKGLSKDGKLFNDIYRPITILPPDQYMALVLQITEGCNYNLCTFCDFYRDRPFRIKSLDEIENHIEKVLQFFGDSISLRKSIFFADANALVTPIDRLLSVAELIRNRIPSLKKLFSFIDVFTGIRKSVDDFSNLKSAGLHRVYLGVESGNNDLLEFLNKVQFEDDILTLAESIKTGGINLGVIFLVGAGGEVFRERHLKDSLNLIKKLPLGKGDIIYISEFYKTNPEYEIEMKKYNLTLPSRMEIREMANEFKLSVKENVPRGVAVSIYDIQQFIY
ncbi:MAG: radical SAM protein [Candidatus Marinimicrobia bacterium]|nr:radical SAM protein [Candidatus Neomarinimicrobiota bacterium]